MLAQLLAGLNQTQGFALLVVCFLVAGTSIAITAIHADARKQLADVDLRRRMIERGMSAEEIAGILGNAEPKGTEDLPCASEAVVEYEGEWHPAYVLKTAPGKFFVHYVGEDVSENEWVDARRVRLPATTGHDPEPGWASGPAKWPAEAEV